MYHYSTQTIDNGTEYLGATNVVANDNNGSGNSTGGSSNGNSCGNSCGSSCGC